MVTPKLLDQTLLTQVELETALRAQRQRYHHLHPFHQRMNVGQLTPIEIQRWVLNRFYYQRSIPLKDAAILSNCPDRWVRQAWIQRLIDQDGRMQGEGGIEAWIELGKATGLTVEELFDERVVLPGVRYAVDAYVHFCRTRPWIEAVAASLTELFGPDAIRDRLSALEQYYPWIDPQGFDYFRTRLTQAPHDADCALRLVLHHCNTRELQERAIQALAFKCELLWSQLDVIERGRTDPEAIIRE